MWTGGRLVIGIGAFFFASLAFAYFYLRSTNSESLWRPDGITAPTAIGAAIFAMRGGGRSVERYGTMRLDGVHPRLGGGRVDRGPRWARRPRSTGVGAHPAAVLPGLERLCIVLHWLGGNEHRPAAGRPLLVGDTAGPRPGCGER